MILFFLIVIIGILSLPENGIPHFNCFLTSFLIIKIDEKGKLFEILSSKYLVFIDIYGGDIQLVYGRLVFLVDGSFSINTIICSL